MTGMANYLPALKEEYCQVSASSHRSFVWLRLRYMASMLLFVVVLKGDLSWRGIIACGLMSGMKGWNGMKSKPNGPSFVVTWLHLFDFHPGISLQKKGLDGLDGMIAAGYGDDMEFDVFQKEVESCERFIFVWSSLISQNGLGYLAKGDMQDVLFYKGLRLLGRQITPQKSNIIR